MEDPRKRLEALANQWDVTYDDVLETATSLIAFGVQSEQPVVLKVVRQPGDEWGAGAVAAAFAGTGAVPVIAHEPGAALLRRLSPAHDLTALARADDADACAVIGGVIRRMVAHEAKLTFGVTAESWGSAFDRYLSSGDSQLDFGLVTAARRTYMQLCSTQRRPGLLHGDLQHYNILYDAELGWTSIDPKGVVAEIEFEFGPALRNPHDMPELYADADRVRARIAMMTAGLDVDITRVQQWAFAQAVLSAIWTIEDEGSIASANAALRLSHCLSA